MSITLTYEILTNLTIQPILLLIFIHIINNSLIQLRQHSNPTLDPVLLIMLL